MTNAIPKMPEARPSYWQAVGKLPYSLTNDYLFRALLQRNNNVLKHLICVLLHLQPEDVNTVTIENPIVLGEAMDNKTFIMDIKVLLDNNAIINLEMQIVNYMNWPERSLSYLCRNFDQLQSGQDYQETKPVIHIGFLDFTLFPECPEFYATYKLMNVKNHH
ncbi:MAG: Rpn family recombination-promoting nuclease/putative transposase, partial [Acetatifactor sp.]|nr:Rpn family recombination-promoting nuclease/putative transposase [Acetatifactor sp.]